MTLETGAPAPDFTLRDQHGQTVTLSSFVGEKAVVLVFYPFAFSGVCTGELCEIRDNLPTFESEEVQLLAVSCDPMFTLRAFSDQEKIEFTMLTDFWPHGKVSTAYDVFDRDFGCSKRSTFVLDTDGTVTWMVHSAMPDPRSVDEYREALSTLRTG